ncbi:MAG: hypothetical protein H0W55_07310 [Actinobacteria bacterium]|nr:hypothetical protein [Actinomycetota bacterium]
MKRVLLWLMVVGVTLSGCSYLEADSCQESVAGCGGGGGGGKLSTEEKLQELIDFCNDYPDRPVCKENNLGQ